MGFARTTNMNDPRGFELFGKDVDDQLEHIIVEQTQGPVDEHPGRRLNQHSRKYQAQLLILAQFAIPTTGLIEQRRQAFEAQTKQRAGKSLAAEALRLQGIRKHFSQATPGQIWRAARQVENLFAARANNAAG